MYNRDVLTIKQLGNMNKLSKITRSDYNVYFTNKDNTIKFPLNLDYLNFQSRVDLKNKVFYSNDENDNVPTINELIKRGELVEHSYVKEYDIMVKDCNNCYDRPEKINLNAIQKEFKENGITVSMSALKYVWLAWKNGCKVGYRGKGFHLFAPCGELNPLSIRATKLDPHFKEWQQTYVC